MAVKTEPEVTSPFFLGLVEITEIILDPKISLQKIGGISTLDILKYPYFVISLSKAEVVNLPERIAFVSVTSKSFSGLTEDLGCHVITSPILFVTAVGFTFTTALAVTSPVDNPLLQTNLKTVLTLISPTF